jgi:deoxycytidylate deaminase
MSDSRLILKTRVMWRFCRSLSKLSTCKRENSHNGCIVYPQDFSEILAIGYNGQPAGLPNDECRDTEGGCGCIHAEANAVAKLSTHRENLILMCTMSPCELCAGLIINCRKIVTVLYGTQYRDSTPLGKLAYAGIGTIELLSGMGELGTLEGWR